MKYKNIEHIAAGQIKTGKAVEKIFQACLGTCVGLALYDRKKKIGGMIHILLPEPVFSNVDAPEKYASTGVPMLLDQLAGLGASPADMEATIAGGALVGPLSQQDLNLDIGGRSADVVLTILEELQIKIVKSETGGFFTCNLELDMENGSTRITPSFETQFTSLAKVDVPTQKDILATIDNLKPIPQTALKILRIFDDPGKGTDDIANELRKDQVLSAQTLKMCNSTFFAGTVAIESLKDAVLLLGEVMFVKTIITAAVRNYFSQTETSGYSLCRGGLFFHATGVAGLSEKITEQTDPSLLKVAYTAGLLHDIGKVILDQYVARYSPYIFRETSQNNRNLIDSEKRILGINHCEAGIFLAKQWRLPETITQSIQFHHLPERAGKNRKLAFIVYLADLIMEKFAAGFELEKMQTKSLEVAIKNLGLDMDMLPKLVDSIPAGSIAGEP